MATHQISILGAATLPDSVGNVWFEPAALTQPTNDLLPQLVARFKYTNTSVKTVLGGNFIIPQNFVSAPVFRIRWTTTATTGDIVWDVDYVSIAASGETFDPAAVQRNVTVTTTAPGTTQLGVQSSLSGTASDMAAGDLVQFGIARDETDVADTMAADAVVYAIIFEYSDV